MNPFWEKVEKVNSKLIPPALILLLGVIIFELFLHIENHALELAIEIVDYFIIAVFVIDLIFLAIKAKDTKFFFKNYWLDILAIFPFVIFSRFIGGVFKLFATSEIVVGQAILHESLEVSKVAVRAERFAKVGRFTRMGARALRFISKGIPRFKRKKLKHMRT
jgi:hypothetical protein